MQLATPDVKPAFIDYSDPRNDGVLCRALYEVQEFKVGDIAETVTRRAGKINAEQWAWTIKMKSGQYKSIVASIEYDPMSGWKYTVYCADAEVPAKRKARKKFSSQ
ncbi:MAG: hypothetical protein WC505_05830 [Patescibacteria group bacterium]